MSADLIDRLAVAASQPEDPTRQHHCRVGSMAGRLAAMLGLSKLDAELIGAAARYHDIGKIGIPASIIGKPGPLSEFERRLVQTHTTIGDQILRGHRSPLTRLAASIALSHHERWDGTGYPRRIAGADIPLAARIVCVADAWDALTWGRPYRPACSVLQALTEIGRHAGTQFDPVIVDALIRVLAEAETRASA